MRFQRVHGWFDSRGLIERHEVFKSNIGQSNSPALTLINETFHCFPGLKQSDAMVINNFSAFVARIHVVSRLKCEGSVDQVKVRVADSKALAARVECRLDPFWPMMGIPELCGDEDIRTGDCSRGELGL